jgi:hypothetical protein
VRPVWLCKFLTRLRPMAWHLPSGLLMTSLTSSGTLKVRHACSSCPVHSDWCIPDPCQLACNYAERLLSCDFFNCPWSAGPQQAPACARQSPHSFRQNAAALVSGFMLQYLALALCSYIEELLHSKWHCMTPLHLTWCVSANI